MLDRFLIEDILKNALIEDMNNGDITSEYLLDDNVEGKATITSKQSGVICGLDVAQMVFSIVDNSVSFLKLKKDGEEVNEGDDIAEIFFKGCQE